MRLNRLDLIRYGRFQDAVITLPKPAPGAPDVTVIFGPNEAGKSTVFNGLLELFFGFKHGAHPYAFRFKRDELLVGAELELPGRGALVFRRNSQRKQSLSDADGRPLSEAILSSALHGLTRDAFEERFSLNDKSLRDGGAQIAKAQGELGQLLHAGLSGLTEMGETLEALEKSADEFHKKSARNTTLNSAAKRLKEIAQEIKGERLTDGRARKLQQECARLAAEFDAAETALSQARDRKEALKSAEIWRSKSAEIAAWTEALACLPDGPELPPRSSERVTALVSEIAHQTDRIREADEIITREDQIIAAYPVDDLAQPLATELDRLRQVKIDGAPLISQADAARVHVDRRRDERDGCRRDMAQVLAALGASEVSTLALSAAPLEALEEALDADREARLKADAAISAARAARAQQGDAPLEPKDMTALRDAFDAWQAVADVSTAAARQSDAAAQMTKALAGLPSVWGGLVDQGLPAQETLDALIQEWASLNAKRDSAQRDVEARADELAQARAAFAVQDAEPDALDMAMTEDTRRQRDALWRLHRTDLSVETADHFEAAMFADDAAHARYVMGAEARQRRRDAQTQACSAEASYDNAKARNKALAAQGDRLSERATKIALALGLEADTPPHAFGARRQALIAAANAAADLANANAALTNAMSRKDTALGALRAAALPHGLAPEQVPRALTLEESNRKAWSNWQEVIRAIETQERQADDFKADALSARSKLAQLAEALPLPDHSPQALRAALPHLRTLQELSARHQDIAGRVEAMEQAIAALTAGAARLAQIMKVPPMASDADPMQVITDATARVNEAERGTDKRTNALSRRDEAATSKRRAEAALQLARDNLEACFKGQGAPELAPFERIEKIGERDRLRGLVATAERARQDARDGVARDVFDAELAGLPNATRAAELEQALRDAQEARDNARDAKIEAERVQREAFEADDRSDLATEQATLLEDLRSGARQAATARLGVLAARGALRRLAQERRSTMLRDVDAAFVAMTKPAWSGVRAEGDRLFGVLANETIVSVDQMSTGTMGQLYFALRLAGYRSFAQDPGPLPMILDDIMETFDDSRARAALRLCADIGTTGQAVLFTHHAHLVELARESIDGVGIVEMPR